MEASIDYLTGEMARAQYKLSPAGRSDVANFMIAVASMGEPAARPKLNAQANITETPAVSRDGEGALGGEARPE